MSTETQADERGRHDQLSFGMLGRKLIRSRSFGLVFFLLVISTVVAISAPQFLEPSNAAVLTRQASFVALVSMGQMLVMIAGGIDLSVGGVAGFAGIAAAWCMGTAGLNGWLSVLLGLLVGGGVGVVNGLLVTRLNLNPFITTLSVGFVLNGLILVITGGWAIQGVPSEIQWLGQGNVAGIPVPALLAIVVAIGIGFMLHRTKLGRQVFAVGGNADAALLAGVPVNRVKVYMYIGASMIAALAGIVMMARLGSGQPTIGESWLLPSFAAAIIGGTSMSGGVGGPLGTIVGALIMSVLENAIVMLGISNYWQQVVIGGALVIAIIIDQVRQRSASRAKIRALSSRLETGGAAS